jgi:hypothetical protein
MNLKEPCTTIDYAGSDLLVIVCEVLHHIYYNRRTAWGPAGLPNKGG